MSYDRPSSHELRIGPNLQKIARKIQKLFVKETGGEVDFILVVNSSSARKMQASTKQVPVGNYIANMSRVSSALSMAELLAKWQINGEIPPLGELKDADGNSLADILNSGTTETHDTDTGVH